MIKIKYSLKEFHPENRMNIVLFEPEIPPNTGNIARLSAATSSGLILIGKLGFKLSDKYLKRAGLDYWPKTDLLYLEDLYTLWNSYPKERFHLITTKSKVLYTQRSYKLGDFLIFGKETAGLPADFLLNNFDRAVTIPMPGKIRSINLSSSAAIVTYEALRQNSFLNKSLKNSVGKADNVF